MPVNRAARTVLLPFHGTGMPIERSTHARRGRGEREGEGGRGEEEIYRGGEERDRQPRPAGALSNLKPDRTGDYRARGTGLLGSFLSLSFFLAFPLSCLFSLSLPSFPPSFLFILSSRVLYTLRDLFEQGSKRNTAIFCPIRCRDAKRIGEALKIYEVSGGEISGYIYI